MKQRLQRSARLHVTHRVVIGQGRGHGREGWVTQSIVAHAMRLRPGSYVLGLLNELHQAGKLNKKETLLPNGTTRYQFQDSYYAGEQTELPF
jgi:hypothetical protein